MNQLKWFSLVILLPLFAACGGGGSSGDKSNKDDQADKEVMLWDEGEWDNTTWK